MMEKQNNIPRLRFPEFEGEWASKKLGKVANIFDGTHQTPNYVASGIPFYSVEQITANDFNKTKFVTKKCSLYILRAIDGFFLFNHQPQGLLPSGVAADRQYCSTPKTDKGGLSRCARPQCVCSGRSSISSADSGRNVSQTWLCGC